MDSNMIRRSFLSSILALSAAPAIVRAESLMKLGKCGLWMPETNIHVWEIDVISDVLKTSSFYDPATRSVYVYWGGTIYRHGFSKFSK